MKKFFLILLIFPFTIYCEDDAFCYEEYLKEHYEMFEEMVILYRKSEIGRNSKERYYYEGMYEAYLNSYNVYIMHKNYKDSINEDE